MNKAEARAVLSQQMASYCERSYGELVQLVGTNSVRQIHGPSGAEYTIEIDVMWDSPRDKRDVRVIAAIDDGRFPGALLPLCDSMLVTPDGPRV